MTRPDLLVLGGGPAGSSLALQAARAGMAVTLLERARFPRDKVCGEFVSAEGCAVLARLGLLAQVEEPGGRWMSGMRITDRRGRPLDLPLPELRDGREALGISRAHLDSVILRAAEQAGVEVRERWEATRALFDGGRVVGVGARPVGRPDEEIELRAGLVAACDGRRSFLARQLHPGLCDPTRSSPGSWFGVEVHFEEPTPLPRRRIELHLFDGGYVGIGPVEGGRVNACLMATVAALRESGSRERLLRQRVFANPAVRDSLGHGRCHEDWNSIGPLCFGVRRPVAAGALFVGDAAGTIDPFCGEGISHALLAAELALPFAVEAIAAGALDREIADGYRAAWLRAFAPVTRRGRAIGALLGRPAIAGGVLGLLRGVGRPIAGRLVAATRTGLATSTGAGS